MAPECQISNHLERALVETLFAIAEFDHMHAKARARGENIPPDPMGGVLLMLRSALDSALSLTWTLTPAQPCAGYRLTEPDSSR
jgi:hypothetical protein